MRRYAAIYSQRASKDAIDVAGGLTVPIDHISPVRDHAAGENEVPLKVNHRQFVAGCEGVTLLAKFDGEFASNSSTYAGTATFRYRWKRGAGRGPVRVNSSEDNRDQAAPRVRFAPKADKDV